MSDAAAAARARARTWRHAAQASVCDIVESWEHGTVVRASRFPSYYYYNLVRVEEDPGMSAVDLIQVVDRALAGAAHRRVDIEPIDVADQLRPDFEARGWNALRLLWMRYEGGAPEPAPVSVEQVPYDAVHGLRLAWHQEDFPAQDPTAYHDQAREVAQLRGAEVVAMFERGEPVAFAQLERAGTGAEISHVYVHPDHRGDGRGTAITRAAIAAASAAGVEDLWILADDEDRPKELYARLGFAPVWTTMELTLWPS